MSVVLLRELFELLRLRYQVQERAVLATFPYQTKRLLEVLGDWPAEEVTYECVLQYVAMRKEEGAAPQTINHEIGYLRVAFRDGIRAGKIRTAPMVERLPVDNVRQGFIDPERFEEILLLLPFHLADVADFAYQTGWRKGEILSLAWPSVYWDLDQIRLPGGQSKNREERIFPLVGRVRDIIKRREKMRVPGCELVFHRKGHSIKDFRVTWAITVARAGFADLRFHDLSRSAVRNMDEAGVPRKVIMELVGKKTDSIFYRYRIVPDQDLRRWAVKTFQYNLGRINRQKNQAGGLELPI